MLLIARKLTLREIHEAVAYYNAKAAKYNERPGRGMPPAIRTEHRHIAMRWRGTLALHMREGWTLFDPKKHAKLSPMAVSDVKGTTLVFLRDREGSVPDNMKEAQREYYREYRRLSRLMRAAERARNKTEAYRLDDERMALRAAWYAKRHEQLAPQCASPAPPVAAGSGAYAAFFDD